jgi:chromosome segregation protein
VAARAVDVERTTVREELHDLKVRLARGAAEFESMRQAAARAELELAENLKSRAGLGLDLERAKARREESQGLMERLRAEAAAMRDERARREERFKADQATLGEVARRLTEVRAQEQGAVTARTKADALLAQAERDAREAAVRLEELAGRLRDELSIELASLEPPAPPKPGEPPFSEAAAEREASSLRRKIEEIGPVNLEALEECDRLAERRKFLSAQVADLETAEENLRAAIRKINETSRKRFLETFEAVRENFQVIFRKLFGGGKADLVLEEGKDVLDAGVEVTARPPGKEARTLTLLSGGEKVLTTVALLFAVFRAKPGPFCILDEVDAALDEHNVGRFVGLVRDFLDRSQFLIVTHNKRTMKAADALYGVTMPEQGVSAPVSVRLGRAEEAAAAVPAEPALAASGGGAPSLPATAAAAS